MSHSGNNSQYFSRREKSNSLISSSPDNNLDRREIGDEALSWELTSAKSGHGVQQLRDDNLTTFWQSDGMVPHSVTILFHKKQIIQCIAIYADYKLDESYTPQDIIVRASSSSTHSYENHIVCKQKLNEPTGWIILDLIPHKRQNKYDKYLKTNKIIFKIKSSHQSGRDTHIRQIKIYAPNSQNIQKQNQNYLLNNTNPILHNVSIFNHQKNNNNNNDDDDSDNDNVKNKKIIFKSKPWNSTELLQYSTLR